MGLVQVAIKPGCVLGRVHERQLVTQSFLGLNLSSKKQVLTLYVCATAVLTCWNASVWLVCLSGIWGKFQKRVVDFWVSCPSCSGPRVLQPGLLQVVIHNSDRKRRILGYKNNSFITTWWLADVLGVGAQQNAFGNHVDVCNGWELDKSYAAYHAIWTMETETLRTIHCLEFQNIHWSWRLWVVGPMGMSLGKHGFWNKSYIEML